jgi:MFS family permease
VLALGFGYCALAFFVAAAIAAVCALIPEKPELSGRAFWLTLAFFGGAAGGGLILFIPLILLLAGISYLFTHDAEWFGLRWGLVLFVPCFLIGGIVCVRAVANDMTRSQNHKALTDK